MNKKRITGEDLASMMPEAVAKMMEVMSHYGKKYNPITKTYSVPALAEDTSVNMNPHKEAIQNAEIIKKTAINH